MYKLLIILAALFLGEQSAMAADTTKANIQFKLPDEVYYVPVTLDTSAVLTKAAKVDGKTVRRTETVVGTKSVNFVVDSGAAYIAVPAYVLRNVTKKALGTEIAFLGGGIALNATHYQVARLDVAGCEFDNVDVVTSPAVTLPLLGETFLQKVEPWSVGDNTLTFTCPPTVTNVAAAG